MGLESATVDLATAAEGLGGHRTLMLVSQAATEGLRAEVAAGSTPCPEYLRLEESGIDLLDWSRLDRQPSRRSPAAAWRHATAAVKLLDRYDVVFSDGEHVGVPLAVAMRMSGRVKPHLMLGHRLTTAVKRAYFSSPASHRGITRILVHSTHQLERANRDLKIPRDKLAFVPYFADTEYWRPMHVPHEALVVSAGIERRDYTTLAQACANIPTRVFVACGSLHSPRSRASIPDRWPANFEVAFTDRSALRSLYARASVVVVPLVANDFQAGVTTILEAMAMGKAVIVSGTAGQRDVVEDGVTGIVVPPGDADALSRAIQGLLADSGECARLGRNARGAVEREFSLTAYCDRLLRHLRSVAQPPADGLSVR